MDNSTPLILLSIAAAIALDLIVWRWWLRRKRNSPPNNDTRAPVRVLGQVSPLLTWLRYIRVGLDRPIPPAVEHSRKRLALPAWLKPEWFEVLIIFVFAVWMGRVFLNFNSWVLPMGGEFPLVTLSHAIWDLLPRCGVCMLWNGAVNGGNPAFVEIHGAPLHPLVALTSLLMGVVNGSKVVLLICLAAAGLSQWWLAKMMGLLPLPRVWVGLMAVAGAHLAGKMENGNLVLMLGQMSAGWVITFLVGLYLRRRPRDMALLGVSLALAWLSGQGYIQIGLLLGILPAALIFCFAQRADGLPFWKGLGGALMLSILLSAVLWLPLLHFWPNFFKDSDPWLGNLQPLAYLPLNLVINDPVFFGTAALGHDLNRYSHLIYIGWLPLLLALLSLRFAPRETNRLQAFFWAAAALVFLVCSLEFWIFWQQYTLQVNMLRTMSAASGLAVPPLLALAGLGADSLIRQVRPVIILRRNAEEVRRPPLMTGVLTAAMLFALLSAYQTSRVWLGTLDYSDAPHFAARVIPPDAQWIALPSEEFFHDLFFIERGAKLTNLWRPWRWDNRAQPDPYLRVVKNPFADPVAGSIAHLSGYDVVLDVRHPYAQVVYDSQSTPCQAAAHGGEIEVRCDVNHPGRLILQENFWDGWYAWVDGVRAPLIQDQSVLTVTAMQGAHVYSFRYLPWDVGAGLMLSLLGLGWALVLFRKK